MGRNEKVAGGARPSIVNRKIDALKPYHRNARTHSKKQIRQIADSITRFGFTNPVLVSDDGDIIAGHGRVEAAKLLGMREVPTLALSHLNETERRAYVLADNKLALNAGWDNEILAIELQGLIDLSFELDLTGFGIAEIDSILDEARNSDPRETDADADQLPEVSETIVSRTGDLWHLGRHRLLCGDARSPRDFQSLLGDERVDLVFTDPPYNVKIDGNVCGLGGIKHREFAFASGEMTERQFTNFLADTLGNAAATMRDGAIAFVCMDWRHMAELLTAGRECFTELKNLVVWNKSNGGMGTFYRSKHELIFVFKQGTAEHTGIEALVHAQFQSATKGNQFALRNILEASAELERRDRARLQAEEAAKHERFEAILRWKARRISKQAIKPLPVAHTSTRWGSGPKFDMIFRLRPAAIHLRE